PEPLAEGRRAARAPGRDGEVGQDRLGGRGRAAEDHRHAAVPDAGTADQGRRLRRRELVQGGFLTAAAAATAAGRALVGSRRLSLSWTGLAPFFIYTALFLFLPTAIILVGSLTDKDGNFTLVNFGPDGIAQSYLLRTLLASLQISAVSGLVGAVAGALLAYAVATGNPRGVLRRVVSSACGVLAQFGGVTLAFAFIATIGSVGFIRLWLQDRGLDIYANGVWLTELPGLVLVYSYFQIPLMVLVF